MKSDPKATEDLKYDIERRLHRVMIKLGDFNTSCPYSKNCYSSENCNRCNIYFSKCTKFKEFNIS